MKNDEKTNVMRVLDSKKAKYVSYSYETEKALSGTEIAEKLGIPPEKTFKTLVTSTPNKKYYVFDVPSGKELDLKKAAASVNEKSLSMIKQAELLPLTGYVHGGCSPIGMKKFFTTVFDISAENFDTVVFSAGKIGRQVEISLDELKKVIPFTLADITQ